MGARQWRRQRSAARTSRNRQQNFDLGKVPKKFSYATWNEGDKVKKNKKKQQQQQVILFSILSRRQTIGQACGWIKDFDRCFRML